MSLNPKIIRAYAVVLPIVNALAFWGLLESFSQYKLNENIAQTGITLAGVLGVLQLFLWWFIFKKRIP